MNIGIIKSLWNYIKREMENNAFRKKRNGALAKGNEELKEVWKNHFIM